MLNILLKKQWAELTAFLLIDKRSGKRRSTGAVILFVLLLAFLAVSVAFAFVGLGHALCGAVVALGLNWLYFLLIAMIALALGLFGSVFTTYSTIYHARDNEFLLSLPIRPGLILFVRMVSVYLMGLLYESIVMIPATVVYWIEKGSPVTVGEIVGPILLWLIVSFLILSLTCLLGWVVALIAARLKNKTFVSVFLTLLFLGIYYFVYFRINTMIGVLLERLGEIGESVRSSAYPLYLIGQCGLGDPLALVIIGAAVLILLALVMWVMARTFSRIALSGSGSKKKVYRQKEAHRSSVRAALLGREFKRFTTSAAYLLNAGLGLLVMPILGILALIYAPTLRDSIGGLLAMFGFDGLMPALAAGAAGLMVSLNAITAPSVSLEGKSIWIVQTMPVDARLVLDAKQHLHLLLNAAASLIFTVCVSVAFRFTLTETLAVIFAAMMFNIFLSALGLAANLKWPNLTWINETVPVKSGMPVFLSLFGGWILSVVMVGLCFFLNRTIAPTLCFVLFSVLLGLAALLLNRWIRRTGASIFATL